MATNILVLGLFCGLAVCSCGLSDGPMLKDVGRRNNSGRYAEGQKAAIGTADEVRRQDLLHIALAEVGVRELSGRNDGERVGLYLRSVGLSEGYPWCAAFVSWVFAQAGLSQPRTAWSPALFNKRVNRDEAKQARVFGIWFPRLGRIAHTGLVEQRQDDYILCIEGNTNDKGNREGDGVYRKRRHLRSIYIYADWLEEQR